MNLQKYKIYKFIPRLMRLKRSIYQMSDKTTNFEENEISNLEEKDINKNNRCKDSIYFDEKRQHFTDLRTLMSYNKLKKLNKGFSDFTEGDILVRTVNYQLKEYNPEIHLDFCKTVRKRYSFKPIQDLYDVLWSRINKDNVDSAETLISVNYAIDRLPEDKRIISRGGGFPSFYWKELLYESNNDKIPDWFKEFLHAVATIGYFMPVPAANQSFLNKLKERFDEELKVIKSYYLTNDCKKIQSEKIINWLNSFGGDKKGWKNFVSENYLEGSFVINDDIVEFDNSLQQLTKIIRDRSKVMLEIYKKINSE